mmetsp:Transcript_43955/g.146469  ORF Transcript_43955/g.146469 Transcript_43955/m.146469 type:complete len:202 (-) Transcript_43955:76-681(-)
MRRARGKRPAAARAARAQTGAATAASPTRRSRRRRGPPRGATRATSASSAASPRLARRSTRRPSTRARCRPAGRRGPAPPSPTRPPPRPPPPTGPRRRRAGRRRRRRRRCRSSRPPPWAPIPTRGCGAPAHSGGPSAGPPLYSRPPTPRALPTAHATGLAPARIPCRAARLVTAFASSGAGGQSGGTLFFLHGWDRRSRVK